jgi:hypothetical protein
MKWMFAALATLALAIFSLSAPTPVFTTKAFASKMNGKGSTCSEGSNCMGDRFRAATKAKKGKK